MPLDFADEPGDQRYELDESQIDRGVLTTPYDAPVRTLINEMQEKSLTVNPSFQRHSVWNATKKSRLIESLLLNIPIPVLYFAEDDDATRVVVDGQQRLRALEEFFNGSYKLTGLQVLAKLNGLRWVDLSSKHANIIQRRTLRCVVISASSPASLRFEMFERLNTGGVTLNDQELRNCIFHGPLNDALVELSKSTQWQSALRLDKPDQRMADIELALRYFMARNSISTYRPPLKQALSNYMKTSRNLPATELKALQQNLLETTAKVHSVFGDDSFRRIRVQDNKASWDRKINRAVFDVQMLSFELLDSNELAARSDEIRGAFENLCQTDNSFWESLSFATANRSAFLKRLRTWGEALRDMGMAPEYLQTLPEV